MDLADLEAEFLQWTKKFFQCSDDQAAVMLQRTQELLNERCAIPAKFSSHAAPFGYCAAYLRESRAVALTNSSRPRTPELICELRQMSVAIGARLPTFNSDIRVSHLPTEVALDINGLQTALGFSARCVEIIRQAGPDAPEAPFARSTLLDLHHLVGLYIKTL